MEDDAALEALPADAGILGIVVDRSALALASAAAWWNGDPSCELLVIGVTGTNGKTTTSFLAAAGLAGAGIRTGLVGTIGAIVGGTLERNSLPQTTPSPVVLQTLLRRMRDAGDAAVVLETSSHGLAADRVASIAYDAAIFTNLSHEHLDFHGTFAAYRAAKRSLFERLPAVAKDGRPGLEVIGIDDPAAPYFAEAARATGARVIGYGEGATADVRLLSIDASPTSLDVGYSIEGALRRLRLGMGGRVNARNALAVMALALGRGLPLDAVEAGLAALPGVPGRMEAVDLGQPFRVIVDFAHTPGAFAALLAELRAAMGGSGRILIVFGASGERDTGKRPLMGRAAAEGADVVIVTQDDPRGEPLGPILDSIAAGAEAAGALLGDRLRIVPDRGEAVATALGLARAGDVVLLAGKGHETWNLTAAGREPWDERAVAEAALRRLGF